MSTASPRCPTFSRSLPRSSVRCSTCGAALEPKDVYPAEGYAERAGGPCEVAIVAGDHFYNGIEDDVCGVVTAWLNETVPGPR
jgi:hypothetical protein